MGQPKSRAANLTPPPPPSITKQRPGPVRAGDPSPLLRESRLPSDRHESPKEAPQRNRSGRALGPVRWSRERRWDWKRLCTKICGPPGPVGPMFLGLGRGRGARPSRRSGAGAPGRFTCRAPRFSEVHGALQRRGKYNGVQFYTTPEVAVTQDIEASAAAFTQILRELNAVFGLRGTMASSWGVAVGACACARMRGVWAGVYVCRCARVCVCTCACVCVCVCAYRSARACVCRRQGLCACTPSSEQFQQVHPAAFCCVVRYDGVPACVRALPAAHGNTEEATSVPTSTPKAGFCRVAFPLQRRAPDALSKPEERQGPNSLGRPTLGPRSAG